MSVDRKNDQHERVRAMLLEGGLVAKADIDRAISRRSETGESLTKTLLAQGSLDARQLIDSLAKQTQFAKIDLSQFEIDPS
ncbi:MAG: hypothetical protein QGG73_06030 [Candidatus Hydrogenedentes bacterium]|nr:hypothetical protein [Candidatus Hydrogenedentota bacterium]